MNLATLMQTISKRVNVEEMPKTIVLVERLAELSKTLEGDDMSGFFQLVDSIADNLQSESIDKCIELVEQLNKLALATQENLEQLKEQK